MSRRILPIAIIFAFFFVASFAAAEHMHGEDRHQHMSEKGKSVEEKVKALAAKLSLTEDQKAQVKNTLTKAKDDAMAILHEAKERAKAIKKTAHDDIKKLLTPEQQAKYDQMHPKKAASAEE